jgi:hypothetical protein
MTKTQNPQVFNANDIRANLEELNQVCKPAEEYYSEVNHLYSRYKVCSSRGRIDFKIPNLKETKSELKRQMFKKHKQLSKEMDEAETMSKMKLQIETVMEDIHRVDVGLLSLLNHRFLLIFRR